MEADKKRMRKQEVNPREDVDVLRRLKIDHPIGIGSSASFGRCNVCQNVHQKKKNINTGKIVLSWWTSKRDIQMKKQTETYTSYIMTMVTCFASTHRRDIAQAMVVHRAHGGVVGSGWRAKLAKY